MLSAFRLFVHMIVLSVLTHQPVDGQIRAMQNERRKWLSYFPLILFIVCDSFGIFLRQLPQTYIAVHRWLVPAGNVAFILGTSAAVFVVMSLIKPKQ